MGTMGGQQAQGAQQQSQNQNVQGGVMMGAGMPPETMMGVPNQRQPQNAINLEGLLMANQQQQMTPRNTYLTGGWASIIG